MEELNAKEWEEEIEVIDNVIKNTENLVRNSNKDLKFWKVIREYAEKKKSECAAEQPAEEEIELPEL